MHGTKKRKFCQFIIEPRYYVSVSFYLNLGCMVLNFYMLTRHLISQLENLSPFLTIRGIFCKIASYCTIEFESVSGAHAIKKIYS